MTRPVDYDAYLLSWRYDRLPLVRRGETFGNIWYDPDASQWRLFVHAEADGGAGYIAQYKSDCPRGPWGARREALGKGAPGTWDEKEVGVPFVWYEAGNTRPWRMIYRGKASGNPGWWANNDSIGLATGKAPASPGYPIVFERKTPDGNGLDYAVSHCANNGGGLIRITCTGHRFVTGNMVSITGVSGTTEANGCWFVTVIDADHFDLEQSAYANAYRGGGTVSAPVISSSGYIRAVAGCSNNGNGLVCISSPGHGFTTGTRVTISGVVGTTEANGGWTVTRIGADTFDLQGSAFRHVYASGGTAAITGTTNGAGGWDTRYIDFGGLIRVVAKEGWFADVPAGTELYLCYYNQIDNSDYGRKIGIAYSTDLVHWSKYRDNPLLFGDPLTAGYYCADVVRWDRTNGQVRYCMLAPHARPGYTRAYVEVVTCEDPLFRPDNRKVIGAAWDPHESSDTFLGAAIRGNVDTPRVVTDDIRRNVGCSTLTGDDVLCPVSFYTGNTWQMGMLIWNRSLHGAILRSVHADLPRTHPKHQLAPTADAHTMALWLPGSVGNLRELSHNDYHLYGEYDSMDLHGVRLVAADRQFCSYSPVSGTADRLNSLSDNFTLECRVRLASHFSSGGREILYYGTLKTSMHKFMWELRGLGGGSYRLVVTCMLGAIHRMAVSNTFSMATDASYRVAFVKSGVQSQNPNYAFFVDGMLNKSVPWYTGELPDTPSGNFQIGKYSDALPQWWDGWIDEIRISDSARYAATYSPVALSHVYEPSGIIFARVSDFVVTRRARASERVVTPAGTSCTKKRRRASGLADQSADIHDFSDVAMPGPKARYQQIALVLTTNDPAASPAVGALTESGISRKAAFHRL